MGQKISTLSNQQMESNNIGSKGVLGEIGKKFPILYKVLPKQFDDDAPETDLQVEERKDGSGKHPRNNLIRSDNSFLEKNPDRSLSTSGKHMRKSKNLLTKKFFHDKFTFVRLIDKHQEYELHKVFMVQENVMRCAKVYKSENINSEVRSKIKNETEIMLNIDHPNILKFYESFYEENRVILVYEYCEGNSLAEKILTEVIPEEDAASITYQALGVLIYLSNLNIVHRNIRPENMIFNPKNSMIKIIGFENATKIKKNNLLHQRIGGSINYISPEMIGLAYNEKTDVWSLGVVIYFMLFGYLPFNAVHENEILDNILYLTPKMFKAKKQKRKQSDSCFDFIERILQKSHKFRFTAKKAINHHWFSYFNIKTSETKKERKEIARKISKFQSSGKIEMFIRSNIARNLLTPEEKECLAELFKVLDKNNDGVIDLNEFRHALQRCKIKDYSEEKMINILRMLDRNKSGKIDYEEFLAGFLEVTKEKILVLVNTLEKQENLSSTDRSILSTIKSQIIISDLQILVQTPHLTPEQQNLEGRKQLLQA